MRIALVAPPFIAIPPPRYGGTELFIAHLASGLQRLGHDITVYANGESHVANCEVVSFYKTSEWPLKNDTSNYLKDLNHTSLACQDAARRADVVHLNNGPGLAFSRFLKQPAVYTIHHAKDEAFSTFYSTYPDVTYVTISEFQKALEPMQRITSIHHGLDLALYPFVEKKQHYMSFLGRIAPPKGPHLAIEVAQKSGIPLKIAGEIQPMYRDYWETSVKPHVDGSLVEFIGEADHKTKVELLGNSFATLFPIQWNEPFGLVMIEAMACGTPVIALPGGSVPEVVRDGVSGWVCRSTDEMSRRVMDLDIPPARCRAYVEDRFSLDRMVRAYEKVYLKALQEQADSRVVYAQNVRTEAAGSSGSRPGRFAGVDVPADRLANPPAVGAD